MSLVLDSLDTPHCKSFIENEQFHSPLLTTHHIHQQDSEMEIHSFPSSPHPGCLRIQHFWARESCVGCFYEWSLQSLRSSFSTSMRTLPCFHDRPRKWDTTIWTEPNGRTVKTECGSLSAAPSRCSLRFAALRCGVDQRTSTYSQDIGGREVTVNSKSQNETRSGLCPNCHTISNIRVLAKGSKWRQWDKNRGVRSILNCSREKVSLPGRVLSCSSLEVPTQLECCFKGALPPVGLWMPPLYVGPWSIWIRKMEHSCHSCGKPDGMNGYASVTLS
jgi:hypothetical protein